MAITFEVSDVPRAQAPLRIPQEPSSLTLNGLPVEAMGAGAGAFLPADGNALLRAVHTAYALHYPLVLSPDAIWLAIAQGFALHVHVNADALRSKFVRHEGEATIVVRRDDFIKGSRDNPWPEVFGAFSDAVAEHIGRQRDLVVCDFSTTGPCERAASEIVLLDAMKRYFRYEFHTLCGIPQITLEGTVDDWRAIRRRARALEEYDTAFWTSELGPVLDEFVAAREGRVNQRFWQTFFKHVDGSGGPYVQGFINVFFPYVKRSYPTEGIERNRWMSAWGQGLDADFGGGPNPDKIPSGLSTVPFVWKYLSTQFSMQFLGGFVGTAQDPTSLAVRPVIGWGVREDVPPPQEEDRALPSRVRDSLPIGAAYLVVGWLSDVQEMALEEIKAIGARIKQVSAEHGAPLAWTIAADLTNAWSFPEAPLGVRFAVGMLVAEASSQSQRIVDIAERERALRTVIEAHGGAKEALSSVIPGGLVGEIGVHLVVSGSRLRGKLVEEATGALVAEVSTSRGSARTLAPERVASLARCVVSGGFGA